MARVFFEVARALRPVFEWEREYGFVRSLYEELPIPKRARPDFEPFTWQPGVFEPGDDEQGQRD